MPTSGVRRAPTVALVAQVAGAVLAAGSGTRMGAPKADLVVDGERLLDRAIHVLSDGGCAPVLAVVRAELAIPGATAVLNPSPERGMRSSLALALDALGDADALLVLLVDLPGVGALAVEAVAAAWHPGRITVATYAGRRGHPIVMAPALWRAALALAGADAGARALLRARPELVDAVDVAGDPVDLDTPDDVRRWGRRG